MANQRAIPQVSNFQLHWINVKRWKTTFGLKTTLCLVVSCHPWRLRRQKMSLLFISLCGVLEEELVLLSHPQEQVWKGTDWFWLQGQCHRVGRHRSHSAGQDMQGSAHSSLGTAAPQNHTQLCPPSYPGTATASGSQRTQPNQCRGGKGGHGSQPGAWAAT